jgi:hypothetical protein
MEFDKVILEKAGHFMPEAKQAAWKEMLREQ